MHAKLSENFCQGGHKSFRRGWTENFWCGGTGLGVEEGGWAILTPYWICGGIGVGFATKSGGVSNMQKMCENICEINYFVMYFVKSVLFLEKSCELGEKIVQSAPKIWGYSGGGTQDFLDGMGGTRAG